MIDFEATQDKLSKHLYTMSAEMGIDAVHIVSENTSYTPQDNTPYLSIHIMIADIEDIGIAFTDIANTKLIFQITLSYPLNIGTDEINIEANYIMERFKRGTKLTTVSDTIRINKSPELANLGRSDDRNTKVISVYCDVS